MKPTMLNVRNFLQNVAEILQEEKQKPSVTVKILLSLERRYSTPISPNRSKSKDI